MTGIRIAPLEAAHVPEAARLLVARHRAHRRLHPLLTSRFEDVAVAEVELAEALKQEAASGAVAFRGGALVGYLLGAPKHGDWGPNVWVESAGQALDEDEPAETMREVYAAAAARWVDEGRTAQYVLTPSHDRPLLDAWFRLAFGHQHSHGIRTVPEAPSPPPAGVTVRRAAGADVPTLARLDLELPAHQGLAPVFSAGTVPTLEECVAEWEGGIDDPEFASFVAECDGQVVGSAVGCAIGKSSMHRGPACADDAGFLGFAAVFPAARGRGVGRALGEAVLWWAAEQGYASVVTDWRTTNLLSSRAWPALGFAETFHRLHRLVRY